MFGEISNASGELLDYSFHAGVEGSRRIAVLGHGVTGNKDRPFVVALAEGLAAAGIHALRFSFAGNGESGGRFVDATISKEVEDLGAVLAALGGYEVCYIGHSMGGAVGVLSGDERIALLVSLAGMVHTRAFAECEFGEEIPDQGCMWEEPDCPLSQAYMDDMAQIDSVVVRGAGISVPWLLVHGTEDDVVPIADSRDILAQAGDNAELSTIDGADHVFSEHSHVMVATVVDWLRCHWA
ncbi:MAG: alpha/beta fold hydrolase [Candidatus Latescibacteria bacterium]|nr:alpha/beta fold hydrolase [Candidatus Latescibacterota bacterium]